LTDGERIAGMNVKKLEDLANEIEHLLLTKQVSLNSLSKLDKNREALVQEIANLQRWAKTIREAIKE
jgi:hypothetical protein